VQWKQFVLKRSVIRFSLKTTSQSKGGQNNQIKNEQRAPLQMQPANGTQIHNLWGAHRK